MVKRFAPLVFVVLGTACPSSDAVLPQYSDSVGGIGDVASPAVLDAVAIKRLGGDDIAGDVAAQDATGADTDADLAQPDADALPGDGGATDAGDAATAVDAGPEDTAVDTSPDAAAPDAATADAGPPDVASPDDVQQPLDTGTSVESNEACLALFSALCARLGQCASEVPFGGDQLAQLAGQCDDVLSDGAADLAAGCEDAASSFAGMSPADSAACVVSYQCDISGLSALGQAIYPLYQSYQDDALADAVPGAADALLDGCK